MKEIFVKFSCRSDAVMNFLNDIDYLRCTNIDFKVNVAHREIRLNELKKIIVYVYWDIPFNFNGVIVDGDNYLIKDILDKK